MNGINAFDKINGISDRFIESSTLPASALAYTSVSPWRKINRFFNSPLGVAILCAVVSLSVVTAIVMAGRGGPTVTPPVGATENETADRSDGTETTENEGTSATETETEAETDELDAILAVAQPFQYYDDTYTIQQQTAFLTHLRHPVTSEMTPFVMRLALCSLNADAYSRVMLYDLLDAEGNIVYETEGWNVPNMGGWILIRQDAVTSRHVICVGGLTVSPYGTGNCGFSPWSFAWGKTISDPQGGPVGDLVISLLPHEAIMGSQSGFILSADDPYDASSFDLLKQSMQLSMGISEDMVRKHQWSVLATTDHLYTPDTAPLLTADAIDALYAITPEEVRDTFIARYRPDLWEDVTETETETETEIETETELVTEGELVTENEPPSTITYTVQVTDDQGRPLPNVAVQLLVDEEDGMGFLPGPTDNSGTYTTDMEEGRYKVQVYLEGYTSAEAYYRFNDDTYMTIVLTHQHPMAEATCIAPATCAEGCGYTKGTVTKHTLSDGVCTGCGGEAIDTAEKLQAIRMNGNYILTADISLEGVTWTPLGTPNAPFTGFFDGNGYTVSNLNITEEITHYGLFGYNSGTICNLAVEGISFSGYNRLEEALYAGGLVAYNRGTVTNCCARDVHIFLRSNAGNWVATVYAGGFVGYSTGAVSRSYASGSLVDITSMSGMSATYAYAGGFVGCNKGGTVTHCYTTVKKVCGSYNTSNMHNGSYVGGFIGANNGGTVVNGYRVSGQKFVSTISSSTNYVPTNTDGIAADLTEIQTVSFHTDTLGWSAEDWIFTDGALPTLIPDGRVTTTP